MDVMFDKRMIAPAQAESPSAFKPAAVMQAWQHAFPEIVIHKPQPVTEQDLCRAHAPEYVQGILSNRLPNGFGTIDDRVAASLPYTVGAMLSAARLALKSGGPVAAPVSGFHHAHWNAAGGFCTFNGLMVTALALQADCPELKIGILDYDYHYGDGTAHILNRLRLNRQDIIHISAGLTWTSSDQANDFLNAITDDLEMLSGCDIVLYQAGGDQHIDDPLGGLLTTAQMRLRDLKVFTHLHARGMPVAWNLAGGYQEPLSKVVQLHVNTLQACLSAWR